MDEMSLKELLDDVDGRSVDAFESGDGGRGFALMLAGDRLQRRLLDAQPSSTRA